MQVSESTSKNLTEKINFIGFEKMGILNYKNAYKWLLAINGSLTSGLRSV
jgi:hypothetical protein